MDFLASFDFGAETTQSNNVQLASIDDLRQHLKGILNAKATATRTEHVAITVELRATVQLILQLSTTDNDAIAGSASIDPSLGGAASKSVSVEQSDGHIHRTIVVNDTLVDQPHDNPALQRAVAKHIVSALGATDESTWTVREVSRGSKGWTFVYACKDSLQMWKRQTSKSHSALVIGEYSYKDPDPVLMSRPAFDCRGSITIGFSQNERSIVITYNHTPIHKTVGQLSELYKPPQKELGPGAQKPKTPKRAPGSAKKASSRAQDGSSQPRKRSKKNGGSQAFIPESSEAAAGNPPGTETNGTIEQQPSDTANSVSAQSQTQPPGFGILSINVAPAEAARRREAARSMLSSAGVDPTSLSPEQFSIFSNQSPELQKESLNMLINYGAERLRIVHPSNSEATSSTGVSTSNTPVHPSHMNPSGPTTIKELVPQVQISENDTPAENGGTIQNIQLLTKAKAKGGKSRVACAQCKQRKVKCPHEKPACRECQDAGLSCEYPAPKPRKKKPISEAVVPADDEDDEMESQQQIQQEQLDQTQPQQNHYPDLEPHTVGLQHDYSQPVVTNASGIEQPEYNPQPHPAASDVDIPITRVSLPEPQPSQTRYFQSPAGHSLPQQEPPILSYPASPAASNATQQRPADGGAKPKRGGWKMPVTSPHVPEGTEQLPQSSAHQPTEQAQNTTDRTNPDQAHHLYSSNVPPPRARSRQGQSTHSRTPLADHTSYSPQQQATSSHQIAHHLDQQPRTTNTASSHRNQRRYNDTIAPAESQSSQRIAYVPYTHQQESRNQQNHDYSRETRSTLNDTPPTRAHATPSSLAQTGQTSQWSSIPGRDARTQQSHPLYHTQAPSFNQSASSENFPFRDYHMRAASTQASQLDHTRVVDRQQTQSPYQPLPQAQPQTQSQPQSRQSVNQHHGWYDVNNSVNSQFASSSHESRQYGWKLPDGSWTGNS